MTASAPASTSHPGKATRRWEDELREICEKSRNDKVLFAKAFFGITPTPFQREVLAGNGRVDAIVAGRRTGKTLAKVIDRVHDLATRGVDRVGFVGAPSLDQAEQYVREIELAADRSQHMKVLLKGGPDKSIRRRSGFPSVELVTGGTLHCRSTVQDGRYLRGKGANWVAISEAAFVNDEVYERVVRALVVDKRGSIHLDTSPNGDNYVKRLFDRADQAIGTYRRISGDGYYTAAHGTVYDNPLLDRADLVAIQTEVPEWVWRTEYLAEFIDDTDAIFSWPLLVQLFDNDYGQLPRGLTGRRYAIGVDLAQLHDYTVLTVLDITQEPYRLAAWRRFRGVPYVGHGGVVEQILELRHAFNRARVYIDATSEQAVAESVPGAEAVHFSQPVRTEMMSHLIVLAESHQLALPAGYRDLRDEMRAMRRVRLAGGTIRADHPRNGYDDCVWSLALACRAVTGRGHVRQSPEALRALREAAFYPR